MIVELIKASGSKCSRYAHFEYGRGVRYTKYIVLPDMAIEELMDPWGHLTQTPMLVIL